MTAHPKKFGMTLETSNRMSGARCLLVLYFLMLFLNLQNVRTMNVHRLRTLTEEDVCKETNKTIKKLKSFPENYIISQEQMQKNICDNLPKCNGEQLVYHCVTYKDDLVEVCAPKRLITGSYCPVFDNGIGRVIEDFSRPCSECPFKYQSADAMKYPSCMNTGKMQSSSPTSNTASSTQLPNISEIIGSPCCGSTRCKRTVQGCTKDKSTSNVIKTNENRPTSGVKTSTFPWNNIILIVSILGISLLATIVFALHQNHSQLYPLISDKQEKLYACRRFTETAERLVERDYIELWGKRQANRGIEKEKSQIDCTSSADKKTRSSTMKPLILIA